MRILYAHCFYRVPGGEDRHVRDQVDLVSRAHDVELISEANVDLAEGPATAARMLYSRAKKQQVGAIIERFAPDVVHVHNAYPSLGPAVLLAARERDVPVVMTVHNFRPRCPNGFMFTEGAMCHRCESGLYVNALVHRCFPTKKQAGAYAAVLWAHRFVMRLEERIARFIVPSEFMGRRLLEWGIGDERVRVIRHFVPSAGYSGSDPRIGSYGAFLGRLSSEKGLDILLAALHRAGDPPFLIVGDGPHRRVLEDLARKLRLATRGFWVGGRTTRSVSCWQPHATSRSPPSGKRPPASRPWRLSRPPVHSWCPRGEPCPSSWPPVRAWSPDPGTRSTSPTRSHSSWRMTSCVVAPRPRR